MASQTKDALIRFDIPNDNEPIFIEHTHPIPLSLCIPTASHAGSSDYHDAYLDLICLFCAQHHAEVMSKISRPCIICGAKAQDAIKSPTSFLYLEQPLITIQITPVCGGKSCGIAAKAQVGETQKQATEMGLNLGDSIYKAMNCAVCQKPNAKRCAGCGKTAYCNKECQKADWKTHKRGCSRTNPSKPGPEFNLPYESI